MHIIDDGDKRRRACDEQVFDVTFDAEQLRIVRTPFGLLIDWPQGHADGTPGGPALPVVAVRIALPLGKRVAEVVCQAGDAHVLAKGEMVAPLQPAAPGVRFCSGHNFLRDDGLVRPWPRPPFVPPDPKHYKHAIELGRRSATLTGEDHTGPQGVATVLLRPVVIDEQGQLLFYTSMRLTLKLRDASVEDETQTQRTRFSSSAQAQRWFELHRSQVVNARDLFDPGIIIHQLFGAAEYLVITDNQRWDATTVSPVGPTSGDLVAEFERLAAWKRTKGLSARVVRIGDIVGGVYGRFHGSCRRDLQEVLREFVKFAHANWGTAWLLLGGDIDIVPVRSVVGNAGSFAPQPTDPPPAGNSFWTGSFLKIRADVAADTPLVRESDGRRIPYDATGSSSATSPGWFFTDASYAMRSTVPTGFVRVNGAAVDIDVPLFWLTNDNTIPTDLYYADIAGYPNRSADGHWVALPSSGRFGGQLRHLCDGHDWDQVGNGLYGQWSFGADLDGVQYRADVSVGRAPVSSGDQARTFVDKVIAYENLGSSLFGASWLRKLLMVSSNWGGRSGFGPANPLADNSYIKRAGDDHAVIQLATAPSSFAYKLISVISDSDQRELPFRLDASATARGWRFARSATDPAPSMIVLSLPPPFPTIQFPIPSRWIVAYGAAGEMTPTAFILDESAADGSMLDQETLRAQLATDVPGWSNVRRLYEDEIDLGPAGAGAPPLEHLTADGIEARLDQGQHIVSLSGHGWWGGCCGLQPGMRTSLTNGSRTFIAYADSCLTNQFDVDDAISESLLQNETGGAVAYVGNTRFSWIGVGDDFQRNFFKGLLGTTALGLLHDRRTAMLSASTGFWQIYNRWTIFSLNLIGDPEMRVWTRPPRGLCIELPDRVRVRQRMIVRVLSQDEPVVGAVVTMQQGSWWSQHRSDTSGRAVFDLQGVEAGPLQAVAVHPGCAVVRATITVLGRVWIDVTPIAISVRDQATAVLTVATGDQEHQFQVDATDAELMPLLERSVHGSLPLRLALTPDQHVEAAELRGKGKAC